VFLVSPLQYLVPAFASQILGDTGIGTANLLTAQASARSWQASLWQTLIGSGGAGISWRSSAILGPVFLDLLCSEHELLECAAVHRLDGLFMIMQFITMNTLIQVEVLDEYRGRVMSLYT